VTLPQLQITNQVVTTEKPTSCKRYCLRHKKAIQSMERWTGSA